MTAEERIERSLERGFEILSLSLSTAILMAGWVPDEMDIAKSPRSFKAVMIARNIVENATKNSKLRSGD